MVCMGGGCVLVCIYGCTYGWMDGWMDGVYGCVGHCVKVHGCVVCMGGTGCGYGGSFGIISQVVCSASLLKWGMMVTYPNRGDHYHSDV